MVGGRRGDGQIAEAHFNIVLLEVVVCIVPGSVNLWLLPALLLRLVLLDDGGHLVRKRVDVHVVRLHDVYGDAALA